MLKRAVVLIILLGFGLYFFVFRTLYYTPTALERSGKGHDWFSRGFSIAAVWPPHSDPSLVEGITFALEEMNAAGGPLAHKVQLRTFEERDRDTSVGRTVASNDDVLAVIGHEYESTTMASSLTYERHGVLFFSTNSSDIRLTAHQFHYVFRYSFDDRDYMHALAQFALDRGWKKVGLLYGRADHGDLASKQFLEVAKELDLEVPLVRSYFHDAAWQLEDFRPLASEVRSRDFDALMIADELPWAGKLLTDLRAMGVTLPVLSTYKLESTDLVPIADGAADNLYVASPIDTDSTSPEYTAFAKRFTERFSTPPSADAVQGYEAAMLFIKACEKSGSADPLVVATTLKTNKWSGLLGEIAFKPNGDVIGRNVEIKRLMRGVFTTVAAEKDVEEGN